MREHFDLRPGAIVRDLDLRRPIYAKTAAYGHFGRTDSADYTWERTDKADALRAAAGSRPPSPQADGPGHVDARTDSLGRASPGRAARAARAVGELARSSSARCFVRLPFATALRRRSFAGASIAATSPSTLLPFAWAICASDLPLRSSVRSSPRLSSRYVAAGPRALRLGDAADERLVLLDECLADPDAQAVRVAIRCLSFAACSGVSGRRRRRRRSGRSARP